MKHCSSLALRDFRRGADPVAGPGRRTVRQVGAAIERGRGQFLQLRRQALRQGRQQGDEQRQGRHDDCRRRGKDRRQRMEGQPAQSRGREDLFGRDHARRRRWAQPERVRARSLLPGGDLAQSAVTQIDHPRRVLLTEREPDIACDGIGGGEYEAYRFGDSLGLRIGSAHRAARRVGGHGAMVQAPGAGMGEGRRRGRLRTDRDCDRRRGLHAPSLGRAVGLRARFRRSRDLVEHGPAAG